MYLIVSYTARLDAICGLCKFKNLLNLNFNKMMIMMMMMMMIYFNMLLLYHALHLHVVNLNK